MKNYEIRSASAAPVTLDGKTLRGYAIVYNSDSLDLGGFTERFLPGSVSDTIKSGLIEAWTYHDRTKPLGSQAAGTLRLFEDKKGLGYEVDLPDTSYANDLRAMMAGGRRDIGGTSFGFMPVKENWKREGTKVVREIASAELDHISPVITPAYPATSAALRSLDGATAKELEDVYGIDLDALTRIFVASKRGLEITEVETQVAKSAIDRLRSLIRTPKLSAAADQANRILL